MKRIEALCIAILMFIASAVYSEAMDACYVQPNRIAAYSIEYFGCMWPSYVLFIGAFIIVLCLIKQTQGTGPEETDQEWIDRQW